MLHKKPTTITRLLTCIILVTFLFTANQAFAGVAEGKTLFQEKCKQCHAVDKKMTGPALQNVKTRWSDSTNLYKWIKNSQGFLGTGDKYANALFKEYNSVMPAFPTLTDGDITDILAFIDEEAIRLATLATTTSGPVTTEAKKDNSTLYWILIIALLFIALILGRAVRYLDGLVRQKYEEGERDKTPIWKQKKYRPLVGIVGLLLLAFLSCLLYTSPSPRD